MPAADAGHGDAPWDDEAIARSWARVVSDYKIFHHVRARGGTVGDLPASLQAAELGLDEHPVTSSGARDARRSGAAMTTGTAAGPAATAAGRGDSGSSRAGAAGAAMADKAAAAAAPAPGFAPPASGTARPLVASDTTVLGGADENLKKLLMSWYYAGYYTGLYEGQQQAAEQHASVPAGQGDGAAARLAEDGQEAAQQ